LFDSEASERYAEWKKRIESLSYIFTNDLDNLIENLESDNKQFDDAFKITKAQHPYIIKAFLRKTITLETLVILEKINPFLIHFDTDLSNDIMWPDISRLIRKYKPFLQFDKEKFNGILRRRIGHNIAEDSAS
jgi:hypothetical protein